MLTKIIITILALLSFQYALMEIASAEDYEQYIHKVTSDLKDMGISLDVFNANPFQTGTALSGYYLQEKTVLLERDSFFQMQSNKLESTEDAAEYAYRLKIMRAHAGNMLLAFLTALEQRNKDGFLDIEKNQNAKDYDALLTDCKKDMNCVADRLADPATNIHNVLIDNFALSTQLFAQFPYLQVIEMNSVYQLIQLLYLEVFYSQNRLASVEFDLFFNKQEALLKSLQQSHALSNKEKQMQAAMIDNTVMKWKNRILERKMDYGTEFKKLAQSAALKNQELKKQINAQVAENQELLAKNEPKGCINIFTFSDHRRCRFRKKMDALFATVDSQSPIFLNAKQAKLPKSFWKEFSAEESL